MADVLWALHAALGTSLIFGLLYHHITNSRTECVNAVTADVLHYFVVGHQADWPSLILSARFENNDFSSALRHGYTALVVDSCNHSCRSLMARGTSTEDNGQSGGLLRLSEWYVSGHTSGTLTPRGIMWN